MSFRTNRRTGAKFKVMEYRNNLLREEYYGFNEQEPFQSRHDAEIFVGSKMDAPGREFVVRKIPERKQ